LQVSQLFLPVLALKGLHDANKVFVGLICPLTCFEAGQVFTQTQSCAMHRNKSSAHADTPNGCLAAGLSPVTTMTRTKKKQTPARKSGTNQTE
jgi:hypothetical protein